jgi:hypothetical protein
MKVQVKVTQILTYEITKEVEMTEKEYKQYIKNGRYSKELLHEISSDIDDQHWTNTQEFITDIEKQ